MISGLPVIAVIFLATSYVTGRVIVGCFFPRFRKLLGISASYIIGYLISFWTVFLLSVLFYRFTKEAIIYAVLITTIVQIIVIISKYRLYLTSPAIGCSGIIFLIVSLIFSWLLFTSTFKYNQQESVIMVSGKVWGDFGFHIPLIRSFSYGNNLGLENPLFANEKLRYHFMFDFSAGVLEKLGLPIDLAFNIPSILSFLCLILLIYEFAMLVFRGNRFVAYLSVILFLFNSSLSFVEFFKRFSGLPIKDLIHKWWNLREYMAIGPWDGNIIVIFWNLNVYINQRHLAFGFSVFLLILIFLIDSQRNKSLDFSKVQYFLIGLFSGLLMLWQGIAFLCLLGIIGLYFLLYPGRKYTLIALITAVLIAAPQILFIQQSQHSGNGLSFHPGFMVGTYLVNTGYLDSVYLDKTLDYSLSFLRFWFYNIGLSLVLIPASFFLLDRENRKIFLIIQTIFIFGSLFRLSIDMPVNHKIFNLWLILSNTFSSYCIYRIYKSRLMFKIISILIIMIMTASGIVDITPIKNDLIYYIEDVGNDPMATWTYKNTDKDDVFQTTYRYYNPISLTGRKTTQGWPYFAWSSGYDVPTREKLSKMIYRPENASQLCELLKNNNIHYVQTEKELEKDPLFRIDLEFYNTNFDPVFENTKSIYKERIYSTSDICIKTLAIPGRKNIDGNSS